ncbi:hypothetical protein BJY52DRAFT_1232793 [Lactarius psammicola]|nr:hypothetical protein BJY52DRAFT_1232793 [Lactarius psammicola]
MRIRVLAESQSGVPQVRSWFNVEQEDTVASLKSSLCASISALREARVRAIELVLLLDDFELLDNTPVHILRDGDLVSLCHRMHPTKRKVEVADDTPRKRHRPSLGANDAAHGYARKETSDSSSSSSSSSSSDTTSDDSSSDSDSNSDSGSTGTSSSSDDEPTSLGPPPASYKHVRKSPRPMPAPVPPGFGKPQTHARNERRRKKRILERTIRAAPPVPGGSINAIPLGAAKPHVPTLEPMMMSLKNKNKRRGFKITSSVPSHITFQGDGIVAPSQPQRLIPPSERDQLPPRLFVTSVDVEAGMWPRDNEQKWDRKQKKVQRDAYGHAEEQADVKLDYGEIPEAEGTITASDLDYAALEKAWVTAPMLGNTTALPINSVVGWQELGINPATLTPETMLFLARVVSSDEHGVVVVRLRRPGLGVVSFGGGDMCAEEEEETFSWEIIVEMQWRPVPTSQ